MNLSTIIFSFVILSMIICGMIYVGANMSARNISDTYGGQNTENVNLTTGLVSNVTSVGQGAGFGGIGILTILVILGGIGLVAAYGRSK